MDNYIKLEENKTYGIPLANGVLRIDVCPDPLYPGIDIEFVPNDDTTNNSTPITRPRVLIEAPIDESTNEQNNLRVLVWGRHDSEDYSDEIEFENEQMSKT